MWRTPIALFGSAGDIIETISLDTYIGDLHDYLGNPTGIRNVILTVDAVDVGEITITTAWASGSTFEFIAINGGRFLGEGGPGGDGGPDFGATGEAGTAGSPGFPAIENQGTFPVSINVDDGFIFGGGGGGGGGSYTDSGVGGDAGGGGGGGQGYNGGAGGPRGTPFTGVPGPTDGDPGSRGGAGGGGIAGGTTLDNGEGGSGGTWGFGGKSGRSSNMISGVGAFAGFFYYGGLGGQAGAAYQGGNLTLSGASSEATLRAAGRILGEIGPNYLTVPGFSFSFWGADIQPTNDNIGIAFQSTGSTLEINTTQTPTASTVYYLTGGSGTGSDYEVRVRNLAGDADPSYFDNPAIAQGSWTTISTTRQWYENYTGAGSKAALFEMRRNDVPGVQSDDVMASFFVKVSMESEP